VDDLRRREQPWQAFLRDGERGAWAAAYNLPEHVAHLCERCEENLVAFLVRRPPAAARRARCGARAAPSRRAQRMAGGLPRRRRAHSARRLLVGVGAALRPLLCAPCLEVAADVRRAAAGQLPASRGRRGTAHCVRTWPPRTPIVACAAQMMRMRTRLRARLRPPCLAMARSKPLCSRPSSQACRAADVRCHVAGTRGQWRCWGLAAWRRCCC
jgi:hypothetical protein